MGEVNPKITQVPINGSGGGLTNIVLTIMASKVEVQEDPSVNTGAPQGLQGYYIDTPPGVAVPTPSPAGLMTWLPNTAGQTGRAYQPIIFGGSDGRVHGGEGNYVGAQGTVVLQLKSLSPTATQILLVEYP